MPLGMPASRAAGRHWWPVREAAEILGVHISAIPEMVRRGDLTPRRSRPSLSRHQVVELAVARETAAADQESRRATASSAPQPPNDDHDWLLAPAAAAVLGVLSGGGACPREPRSGAVVTVGRPSVVPARPR